MIAFAFRHDLRVRWSEVDPQGIVFNPTFFVYADVAVTEYQRAIGLPYPRGLHDHGLDLFVVASSAVYRASANYDDLLSIGVRVARLGRTSLTFDVEIARAELELVRVSLTYVTADLETRRPVVLPTILTSAVRSFETTPPDVAQPA